MADEPIDEIKTLSLSFAGSASAFYHLNNDAVDDAIDKADAPWLGLNADPNIKPARNLYQAASKAYKAATTPRAPYASPIITEADLQAYADALPDSLDGLEATVQEARDEINGINHEPIDATPRRGEYTPSDRLIDAHTTAIYDVTKHREQIRSDDTAEDLAYGTGLLAAGLIAGAASYLAMQGVHAAKAYLAGD